MLDTVRGITIEQQAKLEMQRYKAEEEYLKKGYAMPCYGLTLIRDVYNQIFIKETEKAYREGKDGLSPDVSQRINNLQTLTETKLFNTLSQSFKEDEDAVVSFKFENRMPDEDTSSFFSLATASQNLLNKTRTDSVRLPDSFACKSFELNMTSRGEILKMDNNLINSVDNEMHFASDEESAQ